MSTIEFYGATANGSDSVTVSGVSGRNTIVGSVSAWFEATGPQTGTLQLKNGSTVVWEASVSGGLTVEFEGGWDFGAGVDATLVLSGAHLSLRANTSVTV